MEQTTYLVVIWRLMLVVSLASSAAELGNMDELPVVDVPSSGGIEGSRVDRLVGGVPTDVPSGDSPAKGSEAEPHIFQQIQL